MTADTVVTVTPTIMDGTVVRWYRDLRAAENGNELISASRNGVAVRATYLTDVPDEMVHAARDAHLKLRRDRNVNMHDLATHRHKHVLGHELEPIERVTTDG